jgi:serine/threonine-protein kinase
MTPERWQQIEEIFEAAAERDPRERRAFLDAACGGDAELRREVESLLAHQQPTGNLISTLFRDGVQLLPRVAAPAAHEARFIPGTMLAGRYRLIGQLGKGGMGEVYRADDLKLGQPVALKFLPEKLSKDAAMLERFHREVRTARKVSHPNVCRVFDIGEVDGQQFLSMEYIDGEDLSSLLRRIGRLPEDKATEIARQLCAGLAAAHEEGVLHRDLKPANIMIDGRGRARITDFGLAGLSDEFRGHEIRSGTPAYMSPEQLAGREVTFKSDIYSLGLLLYEVFTGKRAFPADTLDEIIRQRETSTPASISSLVKDIDPLVERAIGRCLEKDPALRVGSALQVAAALPGGDPLAAALAAGDTPSPEMVAAAPKKGALKPAVAVACLASVVALLAFIVFFSGRANLQEWIPLDKPPEVLAERAHQIVNKLGYTDAPRDTAYEFALDYSYLNYAEREDAASDRFEKIRTGQPVTLYFWYRTSPRYLVPTGVREVDFFNPPNDVSGMTSVVLDVRGRLTRFQAVPPQVEERAAQTVPTDWPALFAEAGLDIRNYEASESQWTPPSFADERKAWEGKHVDHAEIPVRIEAAAFRGRPVYFNVVSPWDKPWRQTESRGTAPLDVIIAVAFFSLLLAALVVARHNLKVGRGDTKGAFRLAVFVFSALALARLIDAFHVPELGGELSIFYQCVSLALFVATVTWIFYIALEPFLRRRWSELLISWSRLMAGDFRDPLVGRDILVGGLLGLCFAASGYLSILVPQWSGTAGRPMMGGNTAEAFSGIGGIAGHFLHLFAEPVFFAIFLSFMLLFLLAVLRKKGLAIAAIWLFVFLLDTDFAGSHHWIYWLDLFLTATLITLAAARFGLLALYSCLLFFALCSGFPLTSDFSSWYAGSTFFVIVVITGLTIYGFYTSLAGQPFLKGKLLED